MRLALETFRTADGALIELWRRGHGPDRHADDASPKGRIVTLDTGRLPQETYNVMDATRKKYGATSRCSFPRPKPCSRWSPSTA